jgi:hypothetical protein
MIIKTLVEKYGFSLQNLLLIEKDEFNITEEEAYVLSALIYSSSDNIFSETKIKSLLNESLNVRLHDILTSLETKTLFRLDSGVVNNKKVELLNLSNIYKKIENFLTLESEKSLNNDSDISKIILKLEEILKRGLLPKELENVKNWFRDGIPLKLINQAIDKQEKNYFSVLNVEKTLRSMNVKKSELDPIKSKKLDDIFNKL